MNRRTTLLSFFASASVLLAPRLGRGGSVPSGRGLSQSGLRMLRRLGEAHDRGGFQSDDGR